VSETPRTDNERKRYASDSVAVEFARELERELARLQAAIDELVAATAENEANSAGTWERYEAAWDTLCGLAGKTK
jgi:hypothetical protein